MSLSFPRRVNVRTFRIGVRLTAGQAFGCIESQRFSQPVNAGVTLRLPHPAGAGAGAVYAAPRAALNEASDDRWAGGVPWERAAAEPSLDPSSAGMRKA